MEQFNKLVRDRSDYKQQREDKYKVDSRERLTKIIKKKIETTMIGALSSVEEHMGFLWESDGASLTDEQSFMKDAYQKIRSEILDKGNTQARNVEAELSQYDVTWLKYNIDIPVVKND